MQLEHGVVWPRELRRRLGRHQRLDVVEHGIHGGGGERAADSKFEIPLCFCFFMGKRGPLARQPFKKFPFLGDRGTQQFGRSLTYEHAKLKVSRPKQPIATLFNG